MTMEPWRTKRRLIVEVEDSDIDKVYKFKILLPNGKALVLTLCEPPNEMPLEEFVDNVKHEYFQSIRQLDLVNPIKRIMWKSKDVYLEDGYGNKIRNKICFTNFKMHKCHILQLHDGSADTADNFENMWDLTPDTELLMVLPKEYTFETALADLIDNSLQAVWCNGAKERRLISVEIAEDKLSIFDTGPGMDGSDENSIVRWGKMGASLHRSLRGEAIGDKPPYLMPFFGMFGYGGPMASMHLGRHALVSSKTRESKKVFTLRLEREALVNKSGSEHTWRTDGGIRDPFHEEITKSPHGSFTKVEIFEPKLKRLGIFSLQCKLKDIYFPYIQCDDVSSKGKTIMPIEFQVNGIDLAEIESGEIATTNLHSCNGPEFVLQLRFDCKKDNTATRGSGLQKAHACLKCVYFPIVEGKESIERILEKLDAEGLGISESYETFSRVSIRRLGRLLPDARWAQLPFMEPRIKKGDKAQILKRSCLRVKCFIDTDAGFDPTPYKTDLAHHHPYTVALRNFGNKPLQNDKDVNLEIYKDEKPLSLSQLERDYQEWIFQMHDHYDEEIDCGEDQPVLVIKPTNRKGLGISSDVARVHRIIRRKGISWKSGQKVKILKGACTGCHKNNIYAILEYILLEGFQGDSGGGARIICRPLGLSDERGCTLIENDGSFSVDIRESMSLPISVIDSGKCVAIESAEWDYQVERQRQKAPSAIDILSAKDCHKLDVDSVLPVGPSVYAGHVPPNEIVAVVRPVSFFSSNAAKNLDQKYIVNNHLEMHVEIKFINEAMDIPEKAHHIYSGHIAPSSRKGFHGLYILPLGSKLPNLFQKAGVYTFSFYVKNSVVKSCEKRVSVKASSQVGRWELLGSEKNLPFNVWVGSCFPPFSITCNDVYGNRIPFRSIPNLIVKIDLKCDKPANVNKMNFCLSSDRLLLLVKNVLIESSDLDKIRPDYGANLVICTQDELFSICIPCHVTPGPLRRVAVQPAKVENQLLPRCVVKDFIFEMFDMYGNHVKEGLEVLFEVDGFCFEDKRGPKRKVNDNGCIDLSGLLKVTEGYGKNVSVSVIFENIVIFKQEFQIEKRGLRAASGVCMDCFAGSQLENIVFEVVNSDGEIDETFHNEEKFGQYHMLTIRSELFDKGDSIRYAFRHGRCIIPAIPIPQTEGEYFLVAAHSCQPELNLRVKVIVHAPEMEQNVLQQCSDEKILLLQDTCNPTSVNNLMVSIVNDVKELDDEVNKYGLRIGDLEERLKWLDDRKALLEEDMFELQASVEPVILNHSDLMFEREAMMERIESKGDSAAAVFCNFSRKSRYYDLENDSMKDILDIVALLGTVPTNNLSRPYNGEIKGNDPQRKLLLTDPTHPTGKTPPGFLGYAVNMINLDIRHVHTTTSAGHGLRETLFYCLLGELQVYETREDMKQSRAIIRHGAVSLDGGIMRQNGVVSLGYREPEIQFPVVASENLMGVSSQSMDILKEMEVKRADLRETVAEIVKVNKWHAKTLKKFMKMKERYLKMMDEKGPLIRDYYLECPLGMNRSTLTPS
ncbi:structural maintenance of chromosomes flexible hinge domain-containing protein GMI1 isoform X2 [Malania oleifera]|uniref:structural maintenance of chromosomes flexible hinge domain-containing protein GMI1 isoform X2 n=1 Tax=Malania oleifera TaxID=397392 RepID=UPI0025AEC9EB|nr:structural maintenance of chromosomes flexible hinge domain-containing protein GMI1 isoform X2 [Malania oleifera]